MQSFAAALAIVAVDGVEVHRGGHPRPLLALIFFTLLAEELREEALVLLDLLALHLLHHLMLDVCQALSTLWFVILHRICRG